MGGQKLSHASSEACEASRPHLLKLQLFMQRQGRCNTLEKKRYPSKNCPILFPWASGYRWLWHHRDPNMQKSKCVSEWNTVSGSDTGFSTASCLSWYHGRKNEARILMHTISALTPFHINFLRIKPMMLIKLLIINLYWVKMHSNLFYLYLSHTRKGWLVFSSHVAFHSMSFPALKSPAAIFHTLLQGFSNHCVFNQGTLCTCLKTKGLIFLI